MTSFFHRNRKALRIAGILAAASFFVIGYALAYGDRILPQVRVGTVNIGSMTAAQASKALEEYLAAAEDQGLLVRVENDIEAIHFKNLGFSVSVTESAQEAFRVGRRGSWYVRMWERLAAPTVRFSVSPKTAIDHESLEHEIEALAELIDHPRKDIRLAIDGTRVGILTDTRPGKVIDRDEAEEAVRRGLERLDFSEVPIALKDDVPTVDPALAGRAKEGAQRMLAAPLSLTYAGRSFFINREQIGSWILSGYHGNQLIPTPNERLISQYVTTVANQVNVAPAPPVIRLEDGKVVAFTPPKPGLALEENKTVRMIVDALNERRDNVRRLLSLALPVKAMKAPVEEASSVGGITELIGKATTSFAGSPANRMSNIKNGVKFLTGIIIRPGEEFSTITTLGTIDNTTGYLPELVIKGSETVPEFGGGLCQVSTTLFRAVLNAGLPVTARSNHAYRVSYYEKDGNGVFIGPGLDATIYQPEPDLRFKNDTPNPVLIYGYVEGTRVTFELYGTSDGRTVELKGPTMLSEIPPGDPIYAETDTLPRGVVKQIEFPHPGGSAIAVYKVAYPDGRVEEQQFKSYYRRWPARYLVGTRDDAPPAPPL